MSLTARTHKLRTRQSNPRSTSMEYPRAISTIPSASLDSAKRSRRSAPGPLCPLGGTLWVPIGGWFGKWVGSRSGYPASSRRIIILYKVRCAILRTGPDITQRTCTRGAHKKMVSTQNYNRFLEGFHMQNSHTSHLHRPHKRLSTLLPTTNHEKIPRRGCSIVSVSSN